MKEDFDSLGRLVSTLIRHGVDPCQVGTTALHVAMRLAWSEWGHAIDIMLGVPIGQNNHMVRDQEGRTPLTFALFSCSPASGRTPLRLPEPGFNRLGTVLPNRPHR